MTLARSRFTAAALACLLASFATAALAHRLIAALVALAPSAGDAYDEHAHASVGPVALAAAALLAGLLLRVVASTLARREHRDGLILLAGAARSLDRRFALLAVALGGGATLLGMEFVEQLGAFGRITGAGDALGGNVVLGLTTLAASALLVTVVGLHVLRMLVVATVAASSLVAAWVCGTGATRESLSARWFRRRRRSARASSQRALARSHGLRAPPSRTRLTSPLLALR